MTTLRHVGGNAVGTAVDDPNIERRASSVGLRHEAGLAAGHVMALDLGTYQFGPSANDGAGLDAGEPVSNNFSITVTDPRDIVLTPGEAPLSVDGVAVSKARRIKPGQVIRCGPNAFSVVALRNNQAPPIHAIPTPTGVITPQRVPVPEAGVSIPGLGLWATLIGVGLVLSVADRRAWLLLAAAGVVGAGVAWDQQRRRHQNELDVHTRSVEAARTDLDEQIDRLGRDIATANRSHHPGPPLLFATVPKRALHNRPLAERSVIALGLGTRTWEPPIESRQSLGWDHLAGGRGAGHLYETPALVDLAGPPIAIIGSAKMLASVARYIVAVARLTMTEDELIIDGPETQDWAWLRESPHWHGHNEERSQPIRLVIHDGANGPIANQGIVLLHEDAPVPEACEATLRISDDGFATLTDPDGWGRVFDVVPHGITADALHQATISPATEPFLTEAPSGPPPSIDTAVDRGLVLFTGPTNDSANELLASMAIDIAKRHSADQLQLFVIDEVRHALGRLRLMPQCRHHVNINSERLEQVLDDVETVVAEGYPTVLLMADIAELCRYLNSTGQRAISSRLLRLSMKSDRQQLTVAAAASSNASLGPQLRSVVASRVDRINGQATVTDIRGVRTIEVTNPSARDLTAAVAHQRRRAFRTG